MLGKMWYSSLSIIFYQACLPRLYTYIDRSIHVYIYIYMTHIIHIVHLYGSIPISIYLLAAIYR